MSEGEGGGERERVSERHAEGQKERGSGRETESEGGGRRERIDKWVARVLLG